MRSLLRACTLGLVVALAAGCDWSTSPVALEIEFIPAFSRNEDASCEIQYLARASGIGTLQWERVLIRQGSTVLSELVGPETAEFWPETQISAGEEQLSTPFTVPAGTDDVSIEIRYRISGPERTTLLRPLCSAAA